MATETSSTGRGSDKFMLRLPEGMRDQLKSSALANNRTLNAEIVARMADSFKTAAPREVDFFEMLHRIRQHYAAISEGEEVAIQIKIIPASGKTSKVDLYLPEEYANRFGRTVTPRSKNK
jgi:hypothetical protein